MCDTRENASGNGKDTFVSIKAFWASLKDLYSTLGKLLTSAKPWYTLVAA